MASTLKGGGVFGDGGGRRVRQKCDVIGWRGWGVSEYSGRPVFIFSLLKKIGFGS